MFLDVKINGKPIRAMIDTGATHNYLASAEVERLGLVLEKGIGRVKAINSAAQPIAGVAKSVLIRAGSFEGRTNLSVVVMDDFKLILGLEFLRDTKSAVFPHADSLMMMGNKPCVIPTYAGKLSEKNLSAMQFEKGCKRNEQSYLCTLYLEEDEISGPLPEKVKKLLREFVDVMPDELPRKLPPKRDIDHEIELVPGTKPPARAPYRMSQPELAELRKQLKEMLECGIIKPAKSPYGAPVLFQKKADGSLRIKQARWQELLSEYNFMLEYRAGTSNHVADALSRRADLANVSVVAALASSAVATSVRDRIKELLPRDPAAQNLIDLVGQGKARQFWFEDGLLMTKGNRLYVPKGGDLRKSLITECHDTLWAGHPGGERTNALVQRAYFWPQMRDDVETYVRTCLKDWVKLLDVAQLCFNAQKSSSTNKSAFEIVTGQQPLLPHTIDSPQNARSPLARSFTQEWKQNVEIAQSYLMKAQKRMKKHADERRRFLEFQVGDMVMVKVPDPRLSKASRGRDPRLMQKYIGPLPIIKRIGKVAYKVELPPWCKTHNVHHVSQLKPYSADQEDDSRNQPDRPQLELKKTGKRVVEAILNYRVTHTAKKTFDEYLVKWQGCSSEENTWERVTNLKAYPELIEAYHASAAPRTSPSQVGEMKYNSGGEARSRGSSSHASRNFDGVDEETLYCGCGAMLRTLTSKTKKNPGRRFKSCPVKGERYCILFKWIDDDIHPGTMQIIRELEDHSRSLEGQLNTVKQRYQTMECSFAYAYMTEGDPKWNELQIIFNDMNEPGFIF
ncbi:hypothetical protein BUALT_Bualt16G0123700 [Buddleja alternifolia]|uniref:Chromo domain-containing protein n=1 Tax=Buddleja alternifolia TaxID=168488 RepID=A0AAV6WLX4_9LAMI|nr:hypothetical protein BUALT_Bualt16G0123700 [Buddleja alternifolia]